MVRGLLISLWVFSLAACSAPVTNPVTVDPAAEASLTSVTGKLTFGSEKNPVAGIQVGAYPLDVLHLRGEPPIVSQGTAADGLFSIQLPPGSYYFIASGEKLYSFYGRNPVTVPATGLAGMNLSLVEQRPQRPDFEPLIETGILGQVTLAGKPVSGVVVSIYTDLNSELKGQGLGMTAPTDAEGVFEAPLSPGTYYLVARKRQSGSMMGPLRAGDYFGYYAANPVRIKQGSVMQVPIALVEVPQKVDQLAKSMFGDTSISGRIVDAAGRPLAGIRVLLYDNATMLNRPLFVSQPSAADGSYVISFPQGGRYWLAARNQLGGPPVPGELYGRYLGSQDGSVLVKAGQNLQGVELWVEEMQ